MLRTSSAGSRSKKEHTLREYRRAMAEHRHLVNYLEAAIKVLPDPECDLLWEFAEISKSKCERLRRALERHKHQSAA